MDKRLLASVGLRRQKLGEDEAEVVAKDRIVPARALAGIPQQLECLAIAHSLELHDAQHVDRVDITRVAFECAAIQRFRVPQRAGAMCSERLPMQRRWSGGRQCAVTVLHALAAPAGTKVVAAHGTFTG